MANTRQSSSFIHGKQGRQLAPQRRTVAHLENQVGWHIHTGTIQVGKSDGPTQSAGPSERGEHRPVEWDPGVCGGLSSTLGQRGVAAVLDVCCVRYGPCRLLCWGLLKRTTSPETSGMSPPPRYSVRCVGREHSFPGGRFIDLRGNYVHNPHTKLNTEGGGTVPDISGEVVPRNRVGKHIILYAHRSGVEPCGGCVDQFNRAPPGETRRFGGVLWG